MKTQHTRLAMLAIGLISCAGLLLSFTRGDKEKMKRYEVIHHANGKTVEYDTLIPMSSSYSVDQFLADKGISSENVKILKVPAMPEMLEFKGAEGEKGQVVIREFSNGQEFDWNLENGEEVKIICEIGPDGRAVTRKYVNGEEVELTEEELHDMDHPVGDRKHVKLLVGENGTDVRAVGDGEHMEVKITCEIDENGNVQAHKWVNGEEVPLSEAELEEMKSGTGQHMIIHIDHDSEDGEGKMIEIEKILEGRELGSAPGEGERKIVVIEQEIDRGEGAEKHIIRIDGNEPMEWKGEHTETRVIHSDEEEFTMVFVTENLDSEEEKLTQRRGDKEELEISIYPNPSSGVIILEFTSKEKAKSAVKITDMHGKVVFEEDLGKFSGTYRKEVNLNSFGKGAYLITIQQGNEQLTEKIIVE